MPDSMNILALDFDGVICNSRREVYLVACLSYAELMPASSLNASGLTGGESDPVYARFVDLLPLGNGAEDFGVALKAVDEDEPIADQDAYDQYFARQPERWRTRFQEEFYRRRRHLQASRPRYWAGLHDAFPPFNEVLDRIAPRAVLGIVTAKDRVSVRTLLDHFGIGHLFEEKRVLDKETGKVKTAHLQALAAQCQAPPESILFVDDKVNHLQRAAGLGVRCVLAGWGDNTDRERRLARSLGFPVADLETAEAVIRDRLRL